MTDRDLSCRDVFARLDDFVDRELSQAEIDQVSVHLRSCADCAREQRFESSVLDAVKAKLRHIRAPDHLIARVAQLLDDERRRGSP